MKHKMILLLFVSIAISGCASFNPFKAISDPPNQPKKMGAWEQTSEPIILGTASDGKLVVANKLTYKASAEETEPKLTLGQKIGNFFSGLSMTGLLFILISLLFFGGAPIVWAVKKYFAVKNALRNTVKAIKEIEPEHFEWIKPTLAANQDKADKVIIAKIKGDLH